jgi:DNA mismatch endonuclease (patch repair protein)
MTKIKCRLCNNEFDIKQFGMHVKRKHQIKYQEYAKQYWQDLPKWSPCKLCGEICQDLYCSKNCMSIGLSNDRKGKQMPPRTKEHSKKISEAAKKRLSNPENHPMYGKTHTNETLEKISQTQKERLKDPINHPLYGKNHNEETKKLMSDIRTIYYNKNEQYLKGKTYQEYFGNDKAGEIIKKIFQNKPMNKLEKKVADYLTELGIEYTFQFFINDNNICKSYDFKIKNSNVILEVHGDYWHGGTGINEHVFNVDENIQNDKLKKEIANKRGYEVVVVWESEIKNDISIIQKLLKL